MRSARPFSVLASSALLLGFFSAFAACSDDEPADLPTIVDSGTKDAGRDSGRDSGPSTVDAAVADSGAVDAAAPVDAGPAPVDAGPRDAGPVDSGASVDAGPRDAGPTYPTPLAGEVFLSEINYNGENVVGGSETTFEWFEVYNKSAKTLTLKGVTVELGQSDAPKAFLIADDIVLAPGSYKVLPFNAATCRVPAGMIAVANGAPYSYGDAQAARTLNNSGAAGSWPRLALKVGAVTIDDQQYGQGNFFSGNQQTVQRKDFTAYAAGVTFDAAKWCKSSKVWAGGNANDLGTPGLASDCP